MVWEAETVQGPSERLIRVISDTLQSLVTDAVDPHLEHRPQLGTCSFAAGQVCGFGHRLTRFSLPFSLDESQCTAKAVYLTRRDSGLNLLPVRVLRDGHVVVGRAV
jgi:hypothetical protein